MICHRKTPSLFTDIYYILCWRPFHCSTDIANPIYGMGHRTHKGKRITTCKKKTTVARDSKEWTFGLCCICVALTTNKKHQITILWTTI